MRRIAKTLVIGAMVAGSLALAAPAFASPTPTPTAPVVNPPRPEQFSILITNINPQGLVQARGPVRVRDGTDNTVSRTLDQFQVGGSTVVNVRHSALALPVINPVTCTATISQPFGRWAFTGPRRITGHGFFTLSAQFNYALDRDGNCVLPSPRALLRDIELGTGPVPDAFAIVVHGTGVATRPVVRPPVFAPVSPTATPVSS